MERKIIPRLGLTLILAASFSVAGIVPGTLGQEMEENDALPASSEPERVIPQNPVRKATVEQTEDIMKVVKEYLHPGYFRNTTLSSRGDVVYNSYLELTDGILEFRRGSSLQLFTIRNHYGENGLKESIITSSVGGPSYLNFLGTGSFDNNAFIRTEDNLKSLPISIFRFFPALDWEDYSTNDPKINIRHRRFEARVIDEESRSLTVIVNSDESEEYPSLLKYPPLVAIQIKYNSPQVRLA